MGRWNRPVLWMTCLLACSLACSKKKDAGGQATGTPPAQPSGDSTAAGTAAFVSAITGKGYHVVQEKRFPAQIDARRARVVVYRAADGTRGGVLYLRGFQDDAPRPAWHWYFSNAAPDSVAAIDINRDGLWDMRAYMAGGATQDFIQDTDFTLRGPERTGLLAMNGASSSPDGLWKVFDADTSTSWNAPSSGAYLEIPNPFGLDLGQLSVRLAGGSRPGKLEIGDGAQKLQECDLAATAEEQRFQLDAAVKTMSVIRIQVVGAGKTVALSELELQ